MRCLDKQSGWEREPKACCISHELGCASMKTIFKANLFHTNVLFHRMRTIISVSDPK